MNVYKITYKKYDSLYTQIVATESISESESLLNDSISHNIEIRSIELIYEDVLTEKKEGYRNEV